MAAPIHDLNKPDPSDQYGGDLTAIRDSLAHLAMLAASNGGRLPNWDSVLGYSSGKLIQIVLTHKTYTSVKIKITYAYTGDDLNKEAYFYDKGLGAGFELVSNGVLTYNYTSGSVTSITAGNT